MTGCKYSRGLVSSFLLLLMFAFPAFAAVTSITINAPANATNTSDTTPEINFTILDNAQATLNFTVYVNSGAGFVNITNFANQATNNTPRMFNLTPLANGTHTFRVEASNATGTSPRLNSSTWTITISDTAPTVTISSPANASATTDSTPEITFTLTHSTYTSLQYKIFVNGTNQTELVTATNNTEVKRNLSALPDGTHNISVEGRDPSGNARNATITLTADATAPAASITLSTESTIIGSSVDVTCAGSDAVDLSPSVSASVTKPGGSVASISAVQTFTDTSGAGTYDIICTATDDAGNTASTTKQFTAITISKGGGGGSSSPPPPPVPKASTTFTEIGPTAPGVAKVAKPEIGVKEIVIEVSTRSIDVRITVTKPASPPAAAQSVTGKVFQYLDITAENLGARLNFAIIKFEVEKSLLQQNNFGPEDVVLKRFNVDVWENLPTEMTNDMGDRYQFEATSRGFSTFAIAAEETSPASQVLPQPSSTQTPAPAPSQPAAQQPQQEQPAQPVRLEYYVAGLALVCAIYYLAVSRKKMRRDVTEHARPRRVNRRTRR